MAVGNELTIILRAIDLTGPVLATAKANLASIKTNIGGLNKNLASTTKTVDDLSITWGQFDQQVNRAARSLALVIAALATATIAAVGKSVNEFKKFDTAMASLRMALRDATDEEMADLEAMLIRISKSLPESIEGLTEYAKEVAKIGISGTENIERMILAAVKLREASGDMISADTAVASLGKILTAFDLAWDEAERVGSVISELALATPAEFDEMLEETMKLAAMGKVFGLTMPETAAMIAQIISYGHVAGRTGLRLSRGIQLLIQNNELLAESALKTAKAYGLMDQELIRTIQSGGVKALMEEDPMEFLYQYFAFLEAIPGDIATIEEMQRVLGWMSAYWLPAVQGMGEGVEGMRSLTENIALANEAAEKGTGLQELFEKRLATLAAQEKIVAENIKTTTKLLVAGFSPAMIDLMKNVLKPFANRLVDIAEAFANMRLEGAETAEASQSWVFDVIEVRLEGIADALSRALLEQDFSGILHELTIGIGAITLLVGTWKLAASAIVALKTFMATQIGGMIFNIGTAILTAHFVWEILPEKIKEDLRRALGPLGKSETSIVITLGLTFAIATGAIKAFFAAFTSWARMLPGLSSITVGAGALPFFLQLGMLAAAAISLAVSISKVLSAGGGAKELAILLGSALAIAGLVFSVTGNVIAATLTMALTVSFITNISEATAERKKIVEQLEKTAVGRLALEMEIATPYITSEQQDFMQRIYPNWAAGLNDLRDVIYDIQKLATLPETTEMDVLRRWFEEVAKLEQAYPELKFRFDEITQKLLSQLGLSLEEATERLAQTMPDITSGMEETAEGVVHATDGVRRSYGEATRSAQVVVAAAKTWAEQFESVEQFVIESDFATSLSDALQQVWDALGFAVDVGARDFVTTADQYRSLFDTAIEEFRFEDATKVLDVVNSYHSLMESILKEADPASRGAKRLEAALAELERRFPSLAREVERTTITIEERISEFEIELLTTGDVEQFINSIVEITAANVGNIDALNAISSAVSSLMGRMKDAADFIDVVLSPEEAAKFRAILDVLTARFGGAASAVESFTDRLNKATIPEAITMIRGLASFQPTATTQAGGVTGVAERAAAQTMEQAVASLMEMLSSPMLSIKIHMIEWNETIARAAATAKVAADQQEEVGEVAYRSLGDWLRLPAVAIKLGEFVSSMSDLQSAITSVHQILSFLENIVLATADVEAKNLILESDLYKMLREYYDELSLQFGPEIVQPTPLSDRYIKATSDELVNTIRSAIETIFPAESYMPQIAGIGAAIALQNYSEAFIGALQLIRNVADEGARDIEAAINNVSAALQNLGSLAQNLAQSFFNLIIQSQQLADIQGALGRVQSLLIDALLGFLAPIRWVIEFVLGSLGSFGAEVESAATETQQTRQARKTTASLNIPTGYKLERAAWGVAAPGQPWGGEEEDWQSTERQIKDVFDSVPAWLKGIIEEYRAALEEAGQGIKAFVEKMQEIWQELAPVIIGALIPVLKYFGDALIWVADTVQSTLLPVLTEHLPKILLDLGRAFSDLMASGLVILTGFIADVAVPVIETFSEALAEVASWIRAVLVTDLLNMFSAIGEWWTSEVSPFLEDKVLPQLQEWFEAIYNWIATEFMPFLANEVWPFISGPVWDAIVEGLTMLGDVFMDIWHTVKDKWPEIKDWIVRKIGDFFSGVTSDMQIGFAAFLLDIDGLGASLEYIWTESSLDIWTKVKLSFALGLQTFEGQMMLLGLTLLGIGALFSSPVALMIGGIMAVVGVLPLLAGAIGSAIHVIGGIIENAIHIIGNLLLMAVDLILMPVKIAMNGLIWIVNAVIGLINLLPGVNIPSLPYIPLEEGGHVLEEGLAYLHRGETVVPARAAPYGGQSINIQQMTVVANDPEEFMEKMEAAIRRKNLRGTGQRYGSYATAGA